MRLTFLRYAAPVIAAVALGGIASASGNPADWHHGSGFQPAMSHTSLPENQKSDWHNDGNSWNGSVTGPHSVDVARETNTNRFRETNTNQVNVGNWNHQNAVTGKAVVAGNTWAGDAATGDASNDNHTSTGVDVENHTAIPVVASHRSDGDGNVGFGITGPGSTNVVRLSSTNSARITNNNDVDVSNHNFQNARTGNAVVAGNTIGGSASSGSAFNGNSTDNQVMVSNDTGGLGGNWSDGSNWSGNGFSFGITGPHSHNIILASQRNSFSQTNTNAVDVNNSNHQNARTGNAVVAGNTIGGSAWSGDAANWNDTGNFTVISNA